MTIAHRPASIALVDISYLFKKNWHAMPGKPTEASRQTLADVDHLRAAVNHLILCRDAGPYLRAQRFPDYKAKRPAPEPEELAHKKWLFEQLKQRGIQQAWCQGHEADDVIATLAKAYGVWCGDVRLVTNDKDAAQCVGGSVVQYVPPTRDKGWEVRDRAAVIEKFGVPPEHMPLWQALQGDSVDNIPGIKGIGEKTATDLVQWFKTLPGIIDALGAKDPRIKPAVAQKVGAGLADLPLYIELVTLVTNVPLDAEALLTPAEPAQGREAAADVSLTGYVGNATPSPSSPEGEEAFEKALEIYHESIKTQLAEDEAKEGERRALATKGPCMAPPHLSPCVGGTCHWCKGLPPPRIGKDPNADAFLKRVAEQRAALEQFEAAQDKREAVADNVQQAYRTRREEALRAADKVISPSPRAVERAKIAGEYERQRVAESENDTVSNAPGDKATTPAQVHVKLAPMPMPPVKANLKGLALLRAPFPDHQVSKLPKGTKAQNECPPSEKRNCSVCGGWHHPKIIHLDYVGHAALTDRLLEVDPLWSWEPMAFTPQGLPLFDSTGGLWIRLTVCGVTRLGYGHAAGKPFADAGAREKEIIGDALRNAAMRFGAALELWHKGELHDDNWNPAQEREAS